MTVDGTVLSVALPTVGQGTSCHVDDLECFQPGYLLLLAATVLPARRIGERFGRKKLLVGCLAALAGGMR